MNVHALCIEATFWKIKGFLLIWLKLIKQSKISALYKVEYFQKNVLNAQGIYAITNLTLFQNINEHCHFFLGLNFVTKIINKQFGKRLHRHGYFFEKRISA